MFAGSNKCAGRPARRPTPWLVTWLAPCLALLAGLLAAPAAMAQNTTWLAGMPTAEQVVSAARGVSERDTASQASVALQVMEDIVRNLSPEPFAEQALPPAVKRQLDAYRQARAQVDGREEAKLPRQDCEGDNCEKYLYPRCQQRYYFSAAYRRVLLDRHFTPEWQRTWVPRQKGTLWRDALRLPAGTVIPSDFGTGLPCTGAGSGRLVADPGVMDYVMAALGGGRSTREFIDHMALPLAGVAALLALLLTLHLRLLTRRLALEGSDGMEVGGSARRQLASITGWVLSPSKGLQTITRVSTGQHGTSSSSETIVHDQFFIRSLQGEEREVKLTQVDIPVREGHQFSAVWSSEGPGGKGPFLLLRNHSLNQTLYFDGVARNGLNMGLRWIWLMLLVLIGIGTYAQLAGDAAGLSRHTIPMLNLVLGVPAAVLLAALAVALLLRRRRRMAQFRRQVLDRLVPELDRRAAGQMRAGPDAGFEGVERG